MRALPYNIGLRLAQVPYIRRAIEDRADLGAFDHRLSFKLVLGFILLVICNAFCWPAITALAGLAVYYKRPWIIVIGGPVVYVVTFIGCSVGMALSGQKYVRVLFRWWVRVWVERLLSYGNVRVNAATHPPTD